MFGRVVDYWLLRPFVHGRNRATEEELNRRAETPEAFDREKSVQRLGKIRDRLRGGFPIQAGLRYLDVGCGDGEIARAMALCGATDVTGMDIVERCIRQAQIRAREAGLGTRCRFLVQDILAYHPSKPYDVVLSTEALEHIAEPGQFLKSLSSLVAPGGLVVLDFGPLFHSICGDHMGGFFNILIPWRGVLFSEQAILQLRREFFRPTDPAERFQDIVGGLNRKRYSEFLHYIRDAGLAVQSLIINSQLCKVPPLYWCSEILRRIPIVRNYVVISVYAILRRCGKD